MEMTMKAIAKNISLRKCLRASLLFPTLWMALSSSAQLHEQINVEGKYVPDVIRVEKINAFPKAVEFSMDTKPLDYEQGGISIGFTHALITMPATGWRDSKAFSNERGYLELGAGSWLNSTLSAGYRFIDTPSTLVGVRLQHNSTSLWKPNLSDATADVRQWRYDEDIALYGSHNFKGYGSLDASLDYHIGTFNYYGFYNPYALAGETVDAPTQTLNDFAARVGWRSESKPDALAYNLSARVRHFAFRALPLPVEWGGDAKGNRETNVGIAAGLRMPWESGSSIGLDANLDILLYGGDETVFSHMGSFGESSVSLAKPENYAMLTLTPYYRFTRGLLDVKIGADIDLSFKAGPEGNRYSFFHIAPEAKFAVQTGQFGVWLNALGGSSLNTLAYLWQRDYYMMPALTSTRPSYTPLDASFGVSVGPFAGFSMSLEAAFMTSKNIRLGGWYQPWTDFAGKEMWGFSQALPADYSMLYSLDSEGINIHGFSFGAELSYKLSERLSLLARGNYQPQDGEKGYFNGYDRPRITALFEASVRPLDKLGITASYNYRGVRNIYTRATQNISAGGVAIGGPQSSLMSMRLPDLTLLNLAASWDFSPKFSVWIQADNILNRHDEVLPLQYSQDVVVAGGLKFLF